MARKTNAQKVPTLNREIIDRELTKLVMQDKNLRIKIEAIKEFNRMNERNSNNTKPQKMEIMYKWKDPLPRKNPL